MISHRKLSEIKGTISTSKRLLGLIWEVDKPLFLITGVASVIPAVIPFINVYIYKLVIDLVVVSVNSGSFDATKLYPLFGLRIITYFVQSAAFSTQQFVQTVFWGKAPIFLDHLVYEKTASLDLQYFENPKFQDSLEKVRQSMGFRVQNLINNLFFLLQSVVQVLIALVAITKLNAFLAILVALVSIPEFVNQAKQSKIMYTIWDTNASQRKRHGYLSAMLQHPRNAKEIRIFRLAENFLREIKDIQQRFFKDNLKVSKDSYIFNLLFNGLSAAVFIGVEVFVIFEAIHRRVTVGDIGFYTGVVNNFQNGLGGLFRNINGVFEQSLYVKSMFDLLDTEPIIKEIENPVKLDLKKAPKIEFKNVDFAYPDTDKKILSNFSLIINPGEKIAFVGENGAGKSTIIKLLARFYDVNKGQILINGTDIKNLEIDGWYKNLGILFQDFILYEDIASENIRFGKVYENLDLEKIIDAAKASGAHQVIQGLDKGYDQMLGRMFEGGIELSVGQWQKVALARGFLRDAPVLVLDEPTASIDAKAESEIFSKVEKLSKDKTVIIISHRFSTVRNADKIYVIDEGKIVENGSHEELMKLNGQYATLFNLQAKGYQ